MNCIGTMAHSTLCAIAWQDTKARPQAATIHAVICCFQHSQLKVHLDTMQWPGSTVSQTSNALLINEPHCQDRQQLMPMPQTTSLPCRVCRIKSNQNQVFGCAHGSQLSEAVILENHCKPVLKVPADAKLVDAYTSKRKLMLRPG